MRLLEPPDENALKVAGLVVDSAHYVHSERHAVDVIWRQDLRALQRRCVDILSKSTYLNGGDATSAFTMTLSTGRLPQRAKEAGITIDTHVTSLFNFIDALKLPRNTKEEKIFLYDKIAPFTELSYNSDWFDVFIHSYCERRLFTTDNGYLGLGNHYMIAGDLIAILSYDDRLQQ